MLRIEEWNSRELASLLPHPKSDANKYTRGKLTLIGGSSKYPGAVCLASTAAARMGAGYVEVLCASDTVPVVHSYAPSIVARAWDASVSCEGIKRARSGNPRACLVGSGMDGSDSHQLSMALSIFFAAEVPLLVDGGAITALSSNEGKKAAQERNLKGLITVVTPHFGEATRMAEAASVQVPDQVNTSDVVLAQFAKKLANTYKCTIVLKGPNTYVATADSDTVQAIRLGTPALAKAGTGDVLAGMIASLLAQGLAPRDSAVLGATLHAISGRKAAEEIGDISVIAEDVVSFLSKAILEL